MTLQAKRNPARENFRWQAQLGQRLIRFTEEAKGIIALPLFQPRSCRAMIESVSQHKGWESAKVNRRLADGKIHSIIAPESRAGSILLPAYIPEVCRQFDQKMNDILKPLVQRLWQCTLTDHTGTQLVRYAPGGHYRPHSDAGPGARERYYSVICYLNDNFEGGETRFPSLEYSVKPRPGKAIIFPANYLHGGEPVTGGEKYILVSWIIGPIRND